jgi:hypothetical protein
MSYAAFTAAAPADPAALLPALPATNILRGNPNLALAPAQLARGLAPRVKPAGRLRMVGAVPARARPRA